MEENSPLFKKSSEILDSVNNKSHSTSLNNNKSEENDNNKKDGFPSKQEQQEVFNNIEPDNFIIGEDAYLVPYTFTSVFESWLSDENSEEPKGPINTGEIYDADRKCLKEGLKMEKDAVVISKEAWSVLKKWYGGEDAPVSVIANPENGEPAVISMYINLKLFYNENDKGDVEIKANVYEKTIDVKKRALKALNINFHDDYRPKNIENNNESEIIQNNKEDENVAKLSDFRLLNYFNNKTSNELDDDIILENFGLFNDNEIFVDHKNEEGKWYSDSMESNQSIQYTTTFYTSSNYSIGYTNDYYNQTAFNDTYTPSNFYSSYLESQNSSSMSYSSPISYNYYVPVSNSANEPIKVNSYEQRVAEGPGKVGLQNIGNTCFFNSGVQCLMHSKPLVKELLKEKWDKDLNEKNPLGMHGKLATSFQSLLKDVWKGESCSITPNELKYIVGQFATQFSGYTQQDSHELITFMLDGIHEDLNRCKDKPMVEAITSDGTNDEDTAFVAWETHKLRNDSIIVDHFHGQLRSRLVCPNCHSTTTVFDPFMTLSLPISKQTVRNITVRFVPFDFASKWIGLKLEVPFNTTDEEYSKIISQKIGREVNVVMATLSRYQGTLTWGLSEETYITPTYVACEVPDKSKVYVQCIVRMNTKQGYYNDYSMPDNIGTSFLLPVSLDCTVTNEEEISIDDEKKKELFKKSKDELEEAAKNTLKCCWYPKDETDMNDKIAEKCEKITNNEKDWVEEGHTFGIELPDYYNKSNSLIIRKKENPNIAENKVYIYISDEKRLPENGFSLPSLMRHVEEAEENNEGAEQPSITLEKCFELFSSEEVLDEDNKWFCPKCRQFVCAKKKNDIWKVPQCFIIHLKRFTPGQYTTKKDETNVEFPDELDLKDFIAGPTDDVSTRYRLYAVDEHMGGMGGGHYTAHCLVSEQGSSKGEWYYFNDSSCTKSSASAAHSSSAYVLMYQRIDSECPTVDE